MREIVESNSTYLIIRIRPFRLGRLTQIFISLHHQSALSITPLEALGWLEMTFRVGGLTLLTRSYVNFKYVKLSLHHINCYILYAMSGNKSDGGEYRFVP